MLSYWTYKSCQENEVDRGLAPFDVKGDQKSNAHDKGQQDQPWIFVDEAFDLRSQETHCSDDRRDGKLDSEKAVDFAKEPHPDVLRRPQDIVVIGKIVLDTEIKIMKSAIFIWRNLDSCFLPVLVSLLHVDAFDVGHQGSCARHADLFLTRFWSQSRWISKFSSILQNFQFFWISDFLRLFFLSQFSEFISCCVIRALLQNGRSLTFLSCLK